MLKKILGAMAVVAILAVVWFFQQGGSVKDLQAKVSPGNTGSAPAAATAATNPPGFKQVPDALQSIKENGVVRVSNQNPSEPFYSAKDGVPHGFNVEFAQMLFADPSFASPGASPGRGRLQSQRGHLRKSAQAAAGQNRRRPRYG